MSKDNCSFFVLEKSWGTLQKLVAEKSETRNDWYFDDLFSFIVGFFFFILLYVNDYKTTIVG